MTAFRTSSKGKNGSAVEVEAALARLACPLCADELQSSRGEIRCRSCQAKWPVRRAVPRFAETDFYWGEVPAETMAEVNRLAGETSWLEACRRLIQPTQPWVYRYIVDESRAHWQFLLPLSSESDVLDIGAGWGTLSFALAPVVRSVTSLELVEPRVEFLRLRREQTGLRNVHVVQAQAANLPCAEAAFDTVIVNGVLEWLGLSDTDRDPHTAQRRFLERVCRCLRPGGTLYLAIENRFGFQYLRGAPDHSGLRFTSLLPRSLASLACSMFGKRRNDQPGGPLRAYRTYTYSYWGYKRLLRSAGFGRQQFWVLLPSYQCPDFGATLDGGNALRYVLREWHAGTSASTWLAQALGRIPPLAQAARLLAPAFGIIARKDKSDHD